MSKEISQQDADHAMVEGFEQQPTAGEFTKKFRVLLATQDRTVIVQKAYDLCGRLNSAEARLKVIPDLITACEAMQIRIAFIGLPSEPMNEEGPDWSKEIALLEVAIANAKKEG